MSSTAVSPEHRNSWELKLLPIVEAIVADVGAELFDFKVRQAGRELRIMVVIDNERGWEPGHGVTVEQTTSVARQLNYTIETDALLPGDWSLEVSSPGIERQLSTGAHFAAHAGMRVRLVWGLPGPGGRAVEGTLRGLEGDEVVVEDDGGEVHRAPVDTIRKCRTVFDFGVYSGQQGRKGQKHSKTPAKAGPGGRESGRTSE